MICDLSLLGHILSLPSPTPYEQDLKYESPHPVSQIHHQSPLVAAGPSSRPSQPITSYARSVLERVIPKLLQRGHCLNVRALGAAFENDHVTLILGLILMVQGDVRPSIRQLFPGQFEKSFCGIRKCVLKVLVGCRLARADADEKVKNPACFSPAPL